MEPWTGSNDGSLLSDEMVTIIGWGIFILVALGALILGFKMLTRDTVEVTVIKGKKKKEEDD